MPLRSSLNERAVLCWERVEVEVRSPHPEEEKRPEERYESVQLRSPPEEGRQHPALVVSVAGEVARICYLEWAEVSVLGY